jgi:GNAT superfamily N-acetyltransferase
MTMFSASGRSWDVVTLAERPDLLRPALELGGVGPEFMQHGPVALLASAGLLSHRWPEHFAIVLDAGRVVARAVSIPLAMGVGGRDELPDHGWDAALLWAAEDALRGRRGTCVVALDIQVAEDRRGEGISTVALAALRHHAALLGFQQVVAPVRPTGKAREPFGDLMEYAGRRRPDGLPADPWIRVHVRAGGRIVKPAPFSMTIQGTLRQWRRWTGQPFEQDGLVAVPGGLAPVMVSQALDLGVYVEPNLWIRHDTG